MKPRKAAVKSIGSIISDSQNKFFIILMNWSKIVGKSNAKMMMPVELKQKTLEIAIPNNIVLAATSKFSPLITKKANLCAGEDSVQKLKFIIEPAYFKKEKTEKIKSDPQTIELAEEDIYQKKQELIDKFGLEESIAVIAAKIELLNIKRGQND